MHVLEQFDAAQARRLVEQGEFFWLDLASPDDATTPAGRRAARPAPARRRGLPGVRPAPEARRLRRARPARLLRRPGSRTGCPTPIEVHFHITPRADRRHPPPRRLRPRAHQAAARRCSTAPAASEALYRGARRARLELRRAAERPRAARSTPSRTQLIDHPAPERRRRAAGSQARAGAHAPGRRRPARHPRPHGDVIDAPARPRRRRRPRRLARRLRPLARTSQPIEIVRELHLQRAGPLRLGGLQPPERGHEDADDHRDVLPAADSC